MSETDKAKKTYEQIIQKDYYCPITRTQCISGIIEGRYDSSGQGARCKFWNTTTEKDCLILRMIEKIIWP